jgi:hypothetical protein
MTRSEAQLQILQAANRFRLYRGTRRPFITVLYSKRHINQAVAVCRHSSLVDDDVLVEAGFRPQP